MQRILQDALLDFGILDVEVESAGVNKSSAGQTIAEFSANELRHRGLALEGHVSRYAGDIPHLADFTHVVAVGQAEADALVALCPQLKDRISVIEIPNPWQKGPEAYAECAIVINDEMRLFAAKHFD